MSNWNSLPEQAKVDLLVWFNRVKTDIADKARLAKLYYAGRFHAWDCPTCGARVYDGDPEDWGDLQGVQQRDLVSYPGHGAIFTDEIIGRQCDLCRCWLDPIVTPEHEDTGV